MSKFSVKRPYTVFVIVIAVIVIGIVAMTRMTMDLLPNMSLPYVLVITVDMGASPEKVETDVTAPIEASLATTSNIKNIQSMSSNSYSAVILEYEQAANMDSVMIEIQQKLDQIKGGFEDTVGSPVVLQLDPDLLPVMVAAVSVEDMDNIETSDYVSKEITPQLEGIEGVASVNTRGLVEEKVVVTLNEDKIDALNKKIMKEIDKGFDEAIASITDAKKEIEDGKGKLRSGSDQLASQIGSNTALLSKTEEELYQTSGTLTSQKQQLQTSLDTVSAALTQLSELKGGVDQLSAGIESYDSLIELYDTLGQNDELFEQSTGMTITQVQTERAALAAQMATIDAQVGQFGAALKAFGIQLETHEDIDEAIKTLSETSTSLTAGIAQIDGALSKVEAGKVTTNQAIEAIGKAQIQGTLQIAEATSRLVSGEAQLEAASQQIDSQKDSAKEQADLENVLSLDVVNGLLTAQNFDMPAGYAQSDEGEYLVKIGENVRSVEELEDLVLIDLGMDTVGKIYLKDVADVERTNNASEVYAKINGDNAILLVFEKQTGFSTGDVTDSIQEKFESIKKAEDEHIEFSELMNQGIYIDIIAQSIFQSLILGALLAILVLIIFLRDWRPTVIIAFAIPISVIFAIVLMYFTGITLNIISLSGLTLGIGMLVDNSIVVIENIYRMRKEGTELRKAAVYGASEVAAAITSSTLTTICVFLPIVFTEGITRQLFVDMGLTIAYTLVASLLVALTLVPAVSSKILVSKKQEKEKQEGRLMKAYAAFLGGALRFKPVVFAAALALFILSAFFSIRKGTEFMPDMTSTQMTVTLSVPEGEDRTLEEMTGYSDTLMERLGGIDEIETIGAMYGSGGTLSMFSSGGDSVTIYVILDEDKKLDTDRIEKDIYAAGEDLDCDMTVSSEMMDLGALTGSGVSVMIKGNDLTKLQEIAKEVAGVMEETDGIEEVDDGMGSVTNELVITVDKEKAAKYGLTVAQVFANVSSKLASTKASTSIATDLKDLDVYVETDEQSDITIYDLEKMTFEYTDKESGDKKEEKLSKIADFSRQQEISTILRDSQVKYISVSGTVAEGYNVGLVGNDLESGIRRIDVPEGYSVKITGENETINDAMEQVLLMMLLAVILIYLIMVAQFQSLLSPFIIMFTIPLAFTGGFLALVITDSPVSVIALIGFVMLAGIIVNNGIVLVDYINQRRREGLSKKDAIIDSAKTRLRPIFMTTLTTVISMSVMAFGRGMGTEMARPMALVVVGGLVYGTLLTLIFVPCLYDAFNKDRDMTEQEI